MEAAGTAECDLVETRIELNRGPPRGLWGIDHVAIADGRSSRRVADAVKMAGDVAEPRAWQRLASG